MGAGTSTKPRSRATAPVAQEWYSGHRQPPASVATREFVPYRRSAPLDHPVRRPRSNREMTAAKTSSKEFRHPSARQEVISVAAIAHGLSSSSIRAPRSPHTAPGVFRAETHPPEGCTGRCFRASGRSIASSCRHGVVPRLWLARAAPHQGRLRERPAIRIGDIGDGTQGHDLEVDARRCRQERRLQRAFAAALSHRGVLLNGGRSVMKAVVRHSPVIKPDQLQRIQMPIGVLASEGFHAPRRPLGASI